MSDSYAQISKKIKDRTVKVSVVGLGYVGLPMALSFANKGISVSGFDLSRKRISRLKRGISYIKDVTGRQIAEAVKKGAFSPTSSKKSLRDADVIIICVPTPLRKIKDPDISYILDASRTLSGQLRSGQLIVVESTTFPGTTRDVILPELKKSGLELDRDFFLAFSPERIDPGNEKYGFENIPKVLGGVTGKSTRLGKKLYSMVVEKVVGVSCAEVAEVSKLLENTFRIVNIALIYEFAMLCDKLDIDVWEVIEAAKTKPFGFMPFYPGPGIGGHCIPADPMYLSWKARKVGFRTDMVDLAARLNRMFPGYVANRAAGLIKRRGKKIKGSSVLMLGVAFKRDVNDLRESPALEIIEKLEKKGVKVDYFDPYIPYLDIHDIKKKPVKLSASAVSRYDMVLLATDHSNVDYRLVAENADMIFDTRNVFERNGITGNNIVKL
ncbi:MAG: nucleotide sugar dehydrogenase [Candidatus Omnitrophica bacterium]|nr:nucleotide sugar dehydrogenase [Candidatus Omnitrophota bacterium]